MVGESGVTEVSVAMVVKGPVAHRSAPRVEGHDDETELCDRQPAVRIQRKVAGHEIAWDVANLETVVERVDDRILALRIVAGRPIHDAVDVGLAVVSLRNECFRRPVPKRVEIRWI